MESEIIQDTTDAVLPVRPKKTSLLLTAVFLVFGLVSAYFIVKNTLTSQRITSQAAAGTATLSVLPQSVTLPPNATMQVWISADKPVAFVRTSVTFDPSKLALSEDPTLSTDKLSRVILQKSRAEANTNGAYTFVLGLDPNQRTNPPTGTFQLATLTFTKKTSEPNTTTTVDISAAESSVIDNAAVPLTVTDGSSSVRINPLSSTPSPTTNPSPTKTPTLAPGQPTPTPGINPADLDGNGIVNVVDYTIFMQYWHEKNISKGDFNNDGKITVVDYTLFMNSWYDYSRR